MLHYLKTDWETLKELVRLSMPMVISQGAFAIMMFTDRYFMSQLSPLHLSAALGGGVAAFFCVSLFVGMLSYGNSIVAQYFGANDHAKCSKVLTQSLILAMMSYPLILLMGFAMEDIFRWMDHPENQIQLEVSYFNLLIIGSVITLIKTALASYFSGVGRTSVVMTSNLVGVVLNIPLSYVLIFGEYGFPAWGIIGAAIGTLISSGLTLAILLGYYFAKENRIQFSVMESFGWHSAILKRYVRLGLPSGLEAFLNISAFNLFILMFQSYGVVEGASAAIVLNWDILSFVPMFGIHIAVSSLVGRYIGANKMERVTSVISSGFILALSYSALLGVMFIIFRDPMVGMFVDGDEQGQKIQALASWMMVGMASYVMADAVILVAGGALRGAGDTKWLMYTSTFLHWAMAVAQYVVIEILEYGPDVSWVIFVSMLITLALAYTSRLIGPKWRHPEVIKRMLAE